MLQIPMRKSKIYNAVRSLEDLIRDMRAKREPSRSDATAEWTESDEQALSAAEQAVGPIKQVATEFKRTPFAS